MTAKHIKTSPDTTSQLQDSSSESYDWRHHHVPPNVASLGASAVLGRNIIAERAVEGEGNYGIAQSVWRDSIDNEYIPEARETLVDLTPEQRALFQRQIEHTGDLSRAQLPQWLVELIDSNDDARVEVDKTSLPTSLVDGLVAKNSDGSYRVGDDTFVNFLEWHNYITAQRQIELDSRVESLKAGYAARVYRAVKEGWLPPTIISKLPRLATTDVEVDDGLQTTVRWVLGTHVKKNRHKSRISIGPSVLSDPTHTFTHESNHTLQGFDARGEKGYDSTTIGQLFGGDTEAAMVMCEAITEHVADSLCQGNFDVVNPLAAERAGATYFSERVVLYYLCKTGRVPIDIRLFTAANFEDDDEAAMKDSAIERLKQALDEAFPGENIIQRMAEQESVGEMINLVHRLAIEYIGHPLRPRVSKRFALTSIFKR